MHDSALMCAFIFLIKIEEECSSFATLGCATHTLCVLGQPPHILAQLDLETCSCSCSLAEVTWIMCIILKNTRKSLEMFASPEPFEMQK